MNHRLGLALAGAAILVLLAGGVAYAYFFSGLHTAPKQLALSSPTPAPLASATVATSSGLTGRWTVGPGSQAGYRADENFVGQGAHQAVARTSEVSGGLTVGADAGGSYVVTGVSISVGLGGLKSQDQVAGRDVSQRDGVVQQSLGVRQFPNATFTADSVSVPDSVAQQAANVSIPGALTIHGVSKPVTVTAQAQATASMLEVAGSLPLTMTDYGVSPPQMAFVSVSPQLTVEFDIFLTRGS